MNLPKGLPMPDSMTKQEILKLLLTEEYGFLPAAPAALRAETESCDTSFCAGKAVLEKISLTCDLENGSFRFPVYFICPTKTRKPLPCFIHINFRDLIPDRCLPAEEIVDAGYAVLYFCYKDISSDDGNFRDGLAGLVYPEGRTSSTQCGKIGLWAWGVSRVMDYALTRSELDSSRICAVGHSRLGKTALLAGALDERFYCAFSNDSGCSGAALSRETQGETVKKIYDAFPYWFCENYRKYAENEEALPFDQHFLLAANAPHRVYVASADEDLWADTKNEYLSCVAADGYFREQGCSGFLHPDRLPVPGDFFGQGHIGYHLRAGKHYLSREDWSYFIKYLNGTDAKETHTTMENQYTYEIATLAGLERIWEKNIENNKGDDDWVRWRREYIGYHMSGKSKTFLVSVDGEPVGEGTLLFDPQCRAIDERLSLADGKKTANVNALRIEKAYEGQGHISRLVKDMEKYARDAGYERLTIGVEAHMTRNLAIYLHWGYREFVTWEVEDGTLVLYYAKEL